MCHAFENDLVCIREQLIHLAIFIEYDRSRVSKCDQNKVGIGVLNGKSTFKFS